MGQLQTHRVVGCCAEGAGNVETRIDATIRRGVKTEGPETGRVVVGDLEALDHFGQIHLRGIATGLLKAKGGEAVYMVVWRWTRWGGGGVPSRRSCTS